MSEKHTPGPWEWDAKDGKFLGPPAENGLRPTVAAGGACMCGNHDVWFENEADRPLIEAAPDLLAALRELAECAEEASGRLKPPSGSLDFAIFQARAVLARAEGGAE